MTVHLVGLGIPGSLLARKLLHNGIEFTWSDTNAERTAWRASTGCIYPSGSSKFGPDEPCRRVWGRWKGEGFPHLEEGRWIFNSKRPPHEGKYEFDRLKDSGLGIAVPASYHLNAQQLVDSTRNSLWAHRASPGEGDTVIQTHGFGSRLSHTYWGWTRHVVLELHPSLLDGPRPAFYFREGRLNMAYAYPVPGTALWYAGSSIIKQAPEKMRSLDAEKHYLRWRANFLRMVRGAAKIVEERRLYEGWRPAAAESDEDWVRVWTDERSGAKQLQLRPLWNSGIRHFPKQWTQVADALGIKIPDWERVG